VGHHLVPDRAVVLGRLLGQRRCAVRLRDGDDPARPSPLAEQLPEPVGKVVIGSDGAASFVEAEGMEPLDADHVYQLWGVVGEDKISLAVLDSDPTTATFTVPDQVTTLAVTEERSPGVVSSVQPAVAAGPVV